MVQWKNSENPIPYGEYTNDKNDRFLRHDAYIQGVTKKVAPKVFLQFYQQLFGILI